MLQLPKELIEKAAALKRQLAQLMHKESFMKEQTDIKHLIKHLGEKNYSEADKYLKKVVEDKLQQKISKQYHKQKLY